MPVHTANIDRGLADALLVHGRTEGRQEGVPIGQTSEPERGKRGSRRRPLRTGHLHREESAAGVGLPGLLRRAHPPGGARQEVGNGC